MNQVTAIKQGNEEAFVDIYKEFHVKTYHYFLKRSRLPETAKELTQQTFIKLWQSRHTLSELHTIETQCFNIANSVLIDYLRKQATERKHLSEFQHQVQQKETVTSSDHMHFESSDYLNAMAEKLPPMRRNIFILKMVRGYSNKEIAEQLSVSVKTVEDHYTKAIRLLKLSN